LKEYLYHLAQGKKLAVSSINQAVCGLRFFYKMVLHRSVDFLSEALPFSKKPVRRPQVFSGKEIEQLLTVGCRQLKQRAFLMTVYGAGLRLEEACRLKPEHINRARMQIRVEQGKGRKDRYTLLSPVLLKMLELYWRFDRPQHWLFPATTNPNLPMDPRPAKRCSTVRWPVLVYLTEEASIVCVTALQLTCWKPASKSQWYNGCWGIPM
jgi:integrase